MKTESFQKEFSTWLGERSDQEAAAALGIGRSTVNAYRLGTREPSEMALVTLRARMSAHPQPACAADHAAGRKKK
jgi:hypothetical protein